jgi:hypothetical protein
MDFENHEKGSNVPHVHFVADVSNRGKSRIPRATHSYQSDRSDKQKENEPDINVTSVTQAVQSSLRK